MIRQTTGLTLLFAATMLALPHSAGAEGTSEIGANQRLRASTVYVDILDYTSEDITWGSDGNGNVDVYNPSGTFVVRLNPGNTVCASGGGCSDASANFSENGAYRLEILSGQGSTDNWDIDVSGTAAGFGRVWAYEWYFNTNTFASSRSFNGSWYALVPGGTSGEELVVEMLADGLSGHEYTIAANSSGVDGANGRSTPESGNSTTPEHPIYINPPEIASYSFTTPIVGTMDWSGGTEDCDSVAYGVVDGTFEFTSNVEGVYHIVCDIDADGDFEITNDDDVHLLGPAVVGTNTITWDGTDNTGSAVSPGTYDCVVILTVGEFHYVGTDIETSYEGFRLFNVDGSLNRTGLNMLWNDADVQSNAQEMPCASSNMSSFFQAARSPSVDHLASDEGMAELCATP